MLGKSISDPEGVEEGGEIKGLGLLDLDTVLKKEKTRCVTNGIVNEVGGIFEGLSGLEYTGYEIHMGETNAAGDKNDSVKIFKSLDKDVYGTYIHGIFDKEKIADTVLRALCKKKGIAYEGGTILDYASFKEKEYDRMADVLREHLNMEEIYGMLKEARIE